MAEDVNHRPAGPGRVGGGDLAARANRILKADHLAAQAKPVRGRVETVKPVSSSTGSPGNVAVSVRGQQRESLAAAQARGVVETEKPASSYAGSPGSTVRS